MVALYLNYLVDLCHSDRGTSLCFPLNWTKTGHFVEREKSEFTCNQSRHEGERLNKDH